MGNVALEAATLAVNTPPVNQAPMVNAGPDQAVTLPSAAAFNGSAGRRSAESARRSNDNLEHSQRSRNSYFRQLQRIEHHGHIRCPRKLYAPAERK